MNARMNFELGFQTQAQRLNDDTPMHVYFCGAFSGKTEQENKKITAIDIDNFDEVMAKISPSLLLQSGHKLTFNELDDFHPDSLFETALFSNLRRLKRELNNPKTVAQAADEIWKTYQLTPVESISAAESKPANTENNGDMFERLLGREAQAENTTTTDSINALDKYISTLLAPHIVADTKPEHQQLMVFIDSVIEELMNSILHSAAFQALEALWLSTYDVIF
ncbi:MAG: hypothetical protein GQ569_09965, partial [Methylococcaceae bacterium]|nr:hypothetical protein [Methylococcaceae bacterium]